MTCCCHTSEKNPRAYNCKFLTRVPSVFCGNGKSLGLYRHQHTQIHVHTEIYTQLYTPKYTHTHKHKHTNIHTFRHQHTNSQIRTHKYTHTYTHTYTNTHTQTHNNTYTNIHTHICDRLWEKGAYGAENKNVVFNPSDPDFPTTIGTIIESINVYFYSVRSVGKNP